MISVLLEHIRSLHNVGSIFRTCDGVGVQKIFLTGITAGPPHKDIAKVALGAENSIKSEYIADPLKAIEKFRLTAQKEEKTPIVIASELTEGATSFNTLQLPPNSEILVIFGNENDGVSQEVLDSADLTAYIPMNGEKASLNVGVAAGVMLYKIRELLV